ncbi:MAG: hypothetical protein JZD41_05140 [Thermoproteus sp.]|nr:hypothetical protein [Thermoproteus sp.]
MAGIFFVGKSSPFRAAAEPLRRRGVKVVELPGADAVLYIYDERRGGSIVLEGEELEEYLRGLKA